MKVVLQRANHGCVSVEGEKVGAIERGLVLLVGFGVGDGPEKLRPMAEKIAALRVFPEGKSHFHLSVRDIDGGVLAVPQFTLYGDCSKGRRPEFVGAMPPDEANNLFEAFLTELRTAGIARVEQGRFRAYMQVLLENDGPVTLLLES